jgi:hypothetical protein
MGAIGAMGLAGATGAQGIPGVQGIAGTNGAPGAAGAKGAAGGPTGPAGAIGLAGAAGANGPAYFFSTLNFGQPPVLATVDLPQYLSPNTPGNSTAFYNNTSLPTPYAVQFPRACTASGLQVGYTIQSQSLKGTFVQQLGTAQEVMLQVNGGQTQVKCTTSANAISCTSGLSTKAIAAGDMVNMAIVSGNVGDNNANDFMTVSFVCQ